jgi:hypothetical protein
MAESFEKVGAENEKNGCRALGRLEQINRKMGSVHGEGLSRTFGSWTRALNQKEGSIRAFGRWEQGIRKVGADYYGGGRMALRRLEKGMRKRKWKKGIRMEQDIKTVEAEH